MSTERNYVGRGTSANPTESAVNNTAQAAQNEAERSAVYSQWEGTFIDKADQLINYTRTVENCHQARLMLRSWFMSQVHQGNSPTTSNPGTTEENVYLYELLDDFLSDLLLEQRMQQAIDRITQAKEEEVNND